MPLKPANPSTRKRERSDRPEPGAPTILHIDNLHTQFATPEGVVPAVDGVSLHIDEGTTLALVGESGCGKSMTALSVLRLVPEPGEIVQGQILWQGRDLLALSEAEMRQVRGGQIAMIFQEPMTSLNPVFTVGDQIAEAIQTHEPVPRKQLPDRIIQALVSVGIPDPETRLKNYPHQMSGGMRQRVMIAMAMACSPSLLIADEPTTALDVTIQAQILDLMRQLQRERGMAILLITHDLGVVAELAETVLVMYAGQVVEQAPVIEIFANPAHPYTQGLLRSIPRLMGPLEPLTPIKGTVPEPHEWGTGCRFAPRCHLADEGCQQQPIPLDALKEEHFVRCIKADTPGGI